MGDKLDWQKNHDKLWTDLRTVLFLVKVLGQYGQETLIPWCRCRMCARRFVS